MKDLRLLGVAVSMALGCGVRRQGAGDERPAAASGREASRCGNGREPVGQGHARRRRPGRICRSSCRQTRSARRRIRMVRRSRTMSSRTAASRMSSSTSRTGSGTITSMRRPSRSGSISRAAAIARTCSASGSDQPLEIVNSDDTHAQRARDAEGQPRIQRRPGDQGHERSTKTFTSREVMVPFKCDVHGWMHAFVGVMDHPYFAVTARRRQVRDEEPAGRDLHRSRRGTRSSARRHSRSRSARSRRSRCHVHLQGSTARGQLITAAR